MVRAHEKEAELRKRGVTEEQENATGMAKIYAIVVTDPVTDEMRRTAAEREEKQTKILARVILILMVIVIYPGWLGILLALWTLLRK